jgi:cell division protein FtsB
MPGGRIFWLAIAILNICFLAGTIFEGNRLHKLSGLVDAASQELYAARETREKLEAEVAWNRTRPGMEHQAHDQFLMVRPGEVIYLVRSGGSPED